MVNLKVQRELCENPLESSLIHKGVNMWFCFNLNQQSSFDSSFKQILKLTYKFWVDLEPPRQLSLEFSLDTGES